MKVLQDRSVTQEGAVARLHKHIGTLTDEQEQYKGALRTLNTEVKELTEKLKEEGARKEKEQQAKKVVEKELAAFLGQVEMARVDTVTEFKASWPFIDACAVYSGDEFENCLKQVMFVYPNMDLSKVSMDEFLPSTPFGDIVYEGIDDSIESEHDPKNDSVVLAQPAVKRIVTPLISSTEAPDAENPSIPDA